MRTPWAVTWPTVNSNVNEVIRENSNFFTKRFHTHKTHISSMPSTRVKHKLIMTMIIMMINVNDSKRVLMILLAVMR